MKILEGWMGMASVDKYLQYAAQCVSLAARSSNSGDKARLLQMAQAWRDLSGKRDSEQKRPRNFYPQRLVVGQQNKPLSD